MAVASSLNIVVGGRSTLCLLQGHHQDHHDHHPAAAATEAVEPGQNMRLFPGTRRQTERIDNTLASQVQQVNTYDHGKSRQTDDYGAIKTFRAREQAPTTTAKQTLRRRSF